MTAPPARRRSRRRWTVVAALLVCLPFAGVTLHAHADAAAGHVTFRPARAWVGAQVAYSGHLRRADVSELGPHPEATLSATFLLGRGCELIVALHHDRATVNLTTGAVDGHFTVGSDGGCAHDGGKFRTVRPGRYQLALGCEACTVGVLHLSPAASGHLPFTGFPLGALLVACAFLLLLGIATLRAARRRERLSDGWTPR